MRYDKAAVQAAADFMGLAPRCQKFIELWLAGWTGKDLPQPGSFPGAGTQDIESLIMITLFEPGAGARVTFMGETLKRVMGMDLTGMDWISLAPPELRRKRLRRANTVSAGAVLRTTRQVMLNSRKPYFFETVSVPLSPDAEGRVPLVHFADWAPPEEDAAVTYDMRAVVPEVAEILPLVADEGTHAAAERARQQEGRTKVISRAAMRFMLDLLEIRCRCPKSSSWTRSTISSPSRWTWPMSPTSTTTRCSAAAMPARSNPTACAAASNWRRWHAPQTCRWKRCAGASAT